MASKFQQRHFEIVAKMFQDLRKWEGYTQQTDMEKGYDTGISAVQDALTSLFMNDNPMFQPERFRNACQPGANVKARS